MQNTYLLSLEDNFYGPGDIRPRFNADANLNPKWETMNNRLKKYVNEAHKNPNIHAEQGTEDCLLKRIQRPLTKYEKYFYQESDDYVVCVGGSEMPALLGMDHFKTIDEVADTKVYSLIHGKAKPKCEANVSTKTLHMGTWGHIMEPLLREYVEELFGTTFYEIDGSVPHPRIPYARYSPDGLGIIELWTDHPEYNNGSERGFKNEKKLIYVVLELKCPWGRSVSGEFPTHYMAQLLSGTSTFEFVKAGLFAEGNWKIKPLRYLFTPYYNARIHYQSTSINGKKGPERYDDLELLDCAVICFYSDINYFDTEFFDYGEQKITMKMLGAEIDVDPNSLENGMNPAFAVLSQAKSRHAYTNDGQTYNLVDFGGTSLDEFYLLMRAIDMKLVKVKYYDSYYKSHTRKNLYDPYEQIKEFNQWCQSTGVHSYGFLPVSLYTFAAYYVPAQPFFVDAFQHELKDFSDKVKQTYKQNKN
jgi:hypothetical protein